MKKLYTILILFVLMFGCTLKSYESKDDPMKNQSKITGNKLLKSPISNDECYYWEFAIYDEAGTFVSYKSDEMFYVQLPKEQVPVELQLPPARLYLKPTFEKTYDVRKDQIPKNIKSIYDNTYTDETPAIFTIKEWCLLPDKNYFVKVNSEGYYLPPAGPDDEPQETSSTSYEISDKEYSDKEKQTYKTPESSWTY